MKTMYGTGRISEIINYLLTTYKVKSIRELTPEVKLDVICDLFQFTRDQFDSLIADNSPVLRTVKGHAFETYFDELMNSCGTDVTKVGGDDAVDRIVNGNTLQLKTYTASGTKGDLAQYKTHKTHGAKSEQESLDYYHSIDHFADYLVGLVSYSPLKIVILSKDELPRHSIDDTRILSPFTIDWTTHAGLNNFIRIGLSDNNIRNSMSPKENELLPKTCKSLDITSNVILDTILSVGNFRIWDMAIRGFAKEKAFEELLSNNNVYHCNPTDTAKERADKSDHALIDVSTGAYTYFQMKGLSLNNCTENGDDAVLATETQLTRGRVNDHPTQSRLYLTTDFDYLIIGLDPCLHVLYENKIGNNSASLEWGFFVIPTNELGTHHLMPHRLKSLQKFKYTDLKRYAIDDNWISRWKKKRLE